MQSQEDQPETVTVAVRVKPGAARTKVGGSYAGPPRFRSGASGAPDGAALVVAVTARAVDGKATAAVRQALADALGVRPSAVTLRAGATRRDKLFEVTGVGVAQRVRALTGPP